MDQVTIDQKQALSTFVKLIRAAETVTSAAHSVVSERGLTISQFGVLEAIHYLGPMNQKDLAAKILKSSGNLTMVIDNLQKQGFVERVRDENDRRHYMVHLTEDGKKVISQVLPEHFKRITEVMAIITPEEQKDLGDICRKFSQT